MSNLRKFEIALILLLLLVIKPYVDTNLFGKETDEITNIYSFGYPNCSYTYSYSSYNVTQHYAYCSCGRYTLASHNFYYSNDWDGHHRICSDCGYKVTSNHFTNATMTIKYEDYGDSTYHRCWCECGQYYNTTGTHTFSNNVCTLCGYTKHSCNYTVWVGYSSSGFHIRKCYGCEKTSSTEPHMLGNCSCGGGKYCTVSECDYKDHTESAHSCDYTDSYSSYGSGGHYAYCSCSKYISQSHSMYYCCSSGQYCSKCNYMDHTHGSTHSCSFTYRYVSYGSGGHEAYCSCGNYIDQSHNTVSCCVNGSVCSLCGYKNHSTCHTHSYTYNYTSNGSSGHNAYCSCGAYMTKSHTLVTCCDEGEVCSLCGYKNHDSCYVGSSHTCVYTYAYTYLNVSDTSKHNAYCTCNNYILQLHTITACCDMGTKCSLCGYKNHPTCHTHSYTAPYTSNGSSGHIATCACGATAEQSHSMSTALACGYQYCTKECGYSISGHDYTSSYSSYGSGGHNAYCMCGLSKSEGHSLITLSCGYTYCNKNCGYVSGSHNFVEYKNNGSSGHTIKCTCDATITEVHSLKKLDCGYTYCLAGCGYESGSHSYTNKYVSNEVNGHYSYCICGAYITEEHNYVECCYDGKVCTLCGYKDHTSCHTHSYNFAYESSSSSYHKAFCKCGRYVSQRHTLVACCSRGSKCSLCGYKNHTACLQYHTHGYGYINYDDPINHRADCTDTSCGYSTLDEHNMIKCCALGKVCTKCGYKDHDENAVICVHTFGYTDYGNAENHKIVCVKCVEDLGCESHQEGYCCTGGNKCIKCGYKYGHICVADHEHLYTVAYIIKDSSHHKSYCICDNFIEEIHEIVNGECVKCGYDEDLLPGIAGGTPNNPVIDDGMLPIKWDDTQQAWFITDVYDYEWYDYNNKKWPNITLRDGLIVEGGNGVNGTIEQLKGKKVTTLGSTFVWIPRYSYKNNGEGNVSIYFSNGVKDYTENNYITSPAFFYGEYLGGNPTDVNNYKNRNGMNNELSGIWVAKFMASNSSGHIDIKADKTIYTSDVNTLFNAGKGMSSDSAYGFKVAPVIHMMKASEWSAVAHFTAAVGEEPYINNRTKTGYGGFSFNAGSNENAYLWNTSQGQKASTTNNVTGIFDMSGTVREYVAGYITNENVPIITGNMILDENAADVDKINVVKTVGIANLFNYKLGLAEVMNWNSDEFVIPTISNSVLNKGGHYDQKELAGIYATSSSTGNETYGFRPVILVFDAVAKEDISLFETETTVMPGETAIINLQFTMESNWKMGSTLGNLFVQNATTGNRVIDMYLGDYSDASVANYEINPNVVAIEKNGVQMSSSTIASINANTILQPGEYKMKIAIGGTANGKHVFQAGKTYKVKLNNINLLKEDGNALSVAGIDLNVIKINVIDM